MHMRKLFIPVLAGFAMLSACKGAPEADEAEVTEAQEVQQASGVTYNTNLAQSKIEWIGTKPVARHHGTFNLRDGNLVVSNGEVTGGAFTIDINSITPMDQDAEGNAKLQGHLKSEDFFHVDQFPDGKFEITSIAPGVPDNKDLVMKDATHTVTGNLTLKGVTKSITFPAKITVNDNRVEADADFNIDRTQWNIVYGNDESLGDKFIRPEVNLKVHLVADKL